MAALRQWRIPFLNEFIFGTVPHLGNHAVGVLYPPRLIALLFGSSLGHGLIVVGHMLMLGLGMVALARRFGLSSLGGAIAGVVVVLIGSTQTKTVQFEQIQPLAWLPLLLLALHGCVTARRGWREVGVLAIVATGTLLSGHPQLILEVVFVAALFTIGLIVRYRTGLVRLGVAAGLSVAMALPQLLATLDARSMASLDEGRSFTDLSNGMYILQVRKAAQALFGTITGGDPAAFSGAFEAIGWFGVAGVIVGAIGMVAALKSSSDRWWSLPLAATIILGLIWSLGPRTPVFTIAYRLIPGFDLGRVSVRWLAVVGIALALFVGVGVDAARSLLSRRISRTLASAIVLAAIGIGLGPITSGSQFAGVIWLLTAVLVLIVPVVFQPHHVGRVLGFVVVVELAVMSVSAIPNRITMDSAVGETASPAISELMSVAKSGGSVIALTPDAGPHDELVRGLRPNANTWFDLHSLDGYDGGVQVTQPWTEMLRAFSVDPAIDLPLRSSLSAPVPSQQLGRFGVRWMVLDNDRAPSEWVPGWNGPIAEDARYSVWENPFWNGDSAAWFATRPPLAGLADILRTEYSSVSATAFADVDLNCTEHCQPKRLDSTRITAEHLVITAEVDRPALVVTNVQAFKGWEATVNGLPADALVVDGIFIGIAVDAGNHVIELRYQPAWWWPAVIVAISALVIAMVMVVRQRATS